MTCEPTNTRILPAAQQQKGPAENGSAFSNCTCLGPADRFVSMRGLAGVILVCFALVLASCRMRDYRRASIEVPEMKDQASVAAISKAMSRLAGVQITNVTFDLNRRRVTVVYDSMEIGFKNIEYAIRDAGFTANDIPAKLDLTRPPPLAGPPPGIRPEAAAANPPAVGSVPDPSGK